MSYWISDYPSIINPRKYRSSSSLYPNRYDKFSSSGDGRDGVSPSITHLYSSKFGSVANMHGRGFWTSQHHITASTVASSFSNYYSVSISGGYLFCVAAGDGIYGMCHRKRHLVPHKVDY